MAACENCWSDAAAIAARTGRSVVDVYHELLYVRDNDRCGRCGDPTDTDPMSDNPRSPLDGGAVLMAGLIDRLPHYQLDVDSVRFVKVPPSYHGVVDSGDLRWFLRSDETREALAEAIFQVVVDGPQPDGGIPSHMLADAVIRALVGEAPE